MRIHKFQWDEDEWNVEHIAKHGVMPEECNDVLHCNYKLFKGKSNTHVILVQNSDGRYLFIVIKYLGGGVARPITARDMTAKERKRYKT